MSRFNYTFEDIKTLFRNECCKECKKKYSQRCINCEQIKQEKKQNEYKKLDALPNKWEAFIADNPHGGMMEGDKIPSTHSRAKMDMRYNEPSNAIEKRKQKRQARRENRRYLNEKLKKEDIAPSFWLGL